MKRIIVLIIALSVLISGAAFAQTTYHFTLDGPDNKTYSEKDFPEQYLLIAFGFTSCPDVCPTTLYEFNKTLEILPNPEQIQPIFITIDPLRDDPERLNQYTSFFNKRILGLSSDLDTIKAVADQFGATYGYTDHEGKALSPDNLPSGYIVYHSTIIYLLSPERELIDMYDYLTGAENMAQGIIKAIAANQ